MAESILLFGGLGLGVFAAIMAGHGNLPLAFFAAISGLFIASLSRIHWK